MKYKMFFLALCLSYRPIPTLFIKEFVNMGKFESISFALEQSCIHSQMQCWGLRGSLRLKLFLMRFSLVQLLRCLFLPVLSCTLSGPMCEEPINMSWPWWKNHGIFHPLLLLLFLTILLCIFLSSLLVQVVASAPSFTTAQGICVQSYIKAHVVQ